MGDRRSTPRTRVSGPGRGIAAIAAGTAGGQLIALLAAPVLSRLYTPADLGVYAVVLSLATAVGTVAALRLDQAVPLPRSDREALTLVRWGLLSAAGTAVAGSVVVALFGPTLASLIGPAGLWPWLWFVPISGAAMAAVLVLTSLAARHQRYSAIARRNLVNIVGQVGIQLGAGFAGLRPAGLLLGLAVGPLLASTVLINRARAQSSSDAALAGLSVRETWRRFRRFPLVLAPSGLINVLGLQLPVILIASAYGSEVAGFLGLCQRVLTVPVALIGVAIAQVYLGELAAIRRTNPAGAAGLFARASIRLLAVAAPMTVALTVLAPAAFAFVFGSEWASSGHYARALALALAAQLVAAPLSQTLIVFEKVFVQLAWDVGRLTCVVGALVVCILLGGSPLAAVWTLGAVLSVTYAASWVLSWLTVRRAGRSASQIVSTPSLSAGPAQT